MAETNLSPYWADGTATLTAGSATVTGQSTSWLSAALREGDQIESDAGERATVLTIDGDTAITLDKPWRAAAQTAKPYKIWRTVDSQYTMESARRAFGLLGSGGIQALATLTGAANQFPMFTGPGTLTTVPRQDLINGVAFDARVNDMAGRAVHNTKPAGFTVLVSNIGDGRAAIYTKVTNASGDWSIPAYITGPAITLDVTEVDEVPYGVPPAVVITPKAGGYDLAFDIPRGMLIVPGTTTTLPPDQPAAVAFVPVTGGYRMDLAIPRGPTGDINGVTPFWVTRLGSDADGPAARAGLGADDAGNLTKGTLPDARLPLRVRETSNLNVVADWNNAIQTGWYAGINTTPNAPEIFWHIGRVEATSGTNITQTLWRYGDTGSSNTNTWQRNMQAGVWSAWYRLRLSEVEQRALWDARYIPITDKPDLLIQLGATVPSTSGTAIDFTGIPAGVKRFTLTFTAVSTAGASAVIVQLGGSAGIETTGYFGVVGVISTASTALNMPSSGFQLVTGSPTASRNGCLTFTRGGLGTNTWLVTGSTADNVNTAIASTTGIKIISSDLNRVRVTTLIGTEAFDAGSIALAVEL